MEIVVIGAENYLFFDNIGIIGLPPHELSCVSTDKTERLPRINRTGAQSER